MFWADTRSKDPRIEKAEMTGEGNATLVKIFGVLGDWPNGLAIANGRLYWIRLGTVFGTSYGFMVR